MIIPWATFTARHVGQAYDLGQTDCLALILDAAEKQGVTLPNAFEGITRETYPEFWQRDRQVAKAAFLRFVATLGKEIDPKKAFTGDILIMRNQRNHKQYIGLHAGQDRIITAFINDRIRTASMRLFKIEKAYRIKGIQANG